MKTTTTYRQKDNGWQIIVSYKDGTKWKQKSRQGFPTKREAKEHEEELIKSIKKEPRPVDKALNGITLKEFCDTYIKLKKSIRLGTRRNYVNAVNSLCGVEKKPMNTITYLDVQNAISGWNMKPQTQRQYLSKLKILFRVAVKPYGIIQNNFMPDIEIIKDRTKEERLTITEEQFKKLLSVSRSDVKLAIAICYYTGLRRGGLLGLTWKDVGNDISVNKQLDTQHNITTDPKTKNSFRSIPIPQALRKMLKQYHDTQPLDISRRIFPRPYGTYYGMKQAMKLISKDLSPHCLRHTYATNLLAKGMDIRTVAALLGDNAKTVINTYIHYNDDMRSAAAKEIEKIFAENF
jgi:integrase